MRHDLKSALSANTRKKYLSHWRQFRTFMLEKILSNYLPASSQHVSLYVTHLRNNCKLQTASIRPHLSAIAYYHQLNGFGNPAESFLITQLLNAYKKNDVSTIIRKPITLKILTRLLRSLTSAPLTPYDSHLFRALFLVMYYALLRSSEVCHSAASRHTLKLSEVSIINSHRRSKLKLSLKSFKHSTPNPAPIIINATSDRHCPVTAFKKYLTFRGPGEGPAFRYEDGKPMTRSRLASCLKAHLTLIGLHPSHYNTHSFRQGRATDMARLGFTETQIATAGRWKSTAHRLYVKPSAIYCGPPCSVNQR